MPKYKNIEDIIKESFNQKEFKAPEGLWDSISSEMNAQKIDKKVTESFTKQDEHIAPKGLWSNISNSIGNNTSVDNIVKSSFENAQYKAPKHIWNRLENQMYINKVWLNLNRTLYKNQLVRKSLTIAAATLLLLFAPLKLSDSFFELENVAFSENKPKRKLNQKPTTNENKGSLNTSYLTKNSLASSQDKIRPTENLFLSSQNQILSIHNNDLFLLTLNPRYTTLHLPTEKLPIQTLLTKNDSTISSEETEKQNNQSKFAIGLASSFNNSWIINNETRNGLRPESISNSKLTFTQNYGGIITYNISDDWAITSEVFVFSENKQKITTYVQGKFTNKTTQIDYTKISLSIEKRMSRKKSYSKAQNILKLGTYIGLKNTDTEIQNSSITNYNNQIKDHDIGLKLAAGRINRVSKNIQFEYGIMNDFSLININKESNNIDKYYNFNLGAYVNLKYLF